MAMITQENGLEGALLETYDQAERLLAKANVTGAETGITYIIVPVRMSHSGGGSAFDRHFALVPTNGADEDGEAGSDVFFTREELNELEDVVIPGPEVEVDPVGE